MKNHEQYWSTLFLRKTWNKSFVDRVSGNHPGTLISKFFWAALWPNTFSNLFTSISHIVTSIVVPVVWLLIELAGFVFGFSLLFVEVIFYGVDFFVVDSVQLIDFFLLVAFHFLVILQQTNIQVIGFILSFLVWRFFYILKNR